MGGEIIARRRTVRFPATIKKIGNGYFLSIKKEYVEKMELSERDDVDVTVSLPEVVE